MALGASAVAVTGIAGLTSIVLYGMNIADRKTGNLMDCVQQAVRSLPEIRESLPPVFADALNDQRAPDYIDQLDVSARIAKTTDRHGPSARPVLEIRNKGDRTVSLMSMRVVVVNDDGDPIAEINTWGATPLAVDDNEWRGPLMPGATRLIPLNSWHLREIPRDENLRVECEITEVRTWTPHTASPAEAESLEGSV
jgi:hypothetical protein